MLNPPSWILRYTSENDWETPSCTSPKVFKSDSILKWLARKNFQSKKLFQNYCALFWVHHIGFLLRTRRNMKIQSGFIRLRCFRVQGSYVDVECLHTLFKIIYTICTLTKNDYSRQEASDNFTMLSLPLHASQLLFWPFISTRISARGMSSFVLYRVEGRVKEKDFRYQILLPRK